MQGVCEDAGETVGAVAGVEERTINPGAASGSLE